MIFVIGTIIASMTYVFAGVLTGLWANDSVPPRDESFSTVCGVFWPVFWVLFAPVFLAWKFHSKQRKVEIPKATARKAAP